MKNARTKISIASALASMSFIAVAVFSHSEVMAAAGGIQDCTVGTSCKVGEFLYDDASAPINDAACTIASWYPDDTVFFAALTAMDVPTQADGWYSKTFTAPATTGLYRTTVSCTVSGDTLTIDKSFQVNAVSSSDPNAVATAVWSYSTRTVQSIGSFGTLIADIWANATRTLTGEGLSSGKLATQSDVTSVRDKVDSLSTATAITNSTTVTNNITDIKNITEETRLLMEKVVNKPVIQNVLEDNSVPLTDKLDGTRTMANQLYVNNQFMTAQTATLVSGWNKTSGKDLLDSIISLSNILGTTGDSSNTNTMFGSANWIRDSWSWDESAKVYDQLVATDKIISELKEGLADYQKTPALYAQAKLLVKNSLALEKTIGTVTDKGNSKTLFSKIKGTTELAVKLDEKGQEVDRVLGAYTKSPGQAGTLSQVNGLKNQIIALNKVPGAGNALAVVNPQNKNSIKNVLLGLRGIVNSNKKLLSLGSGQTLINTWLEIGSIVFKTMATNPSTLISQTVDVKYYLPQEIKKEDVIKTDPGLSVEYDSEKDQYYVAGSFSLAAGQTRTFSVETKDIWEKSPAQIQSIRDQANELSKPLEKTAFYAQGISLKSDIMASMDQIAILMEGAVTPEEKIKAFRQAEILENSANTKLAGMKELVTQASAAGSLFGFVGGSQTIAVWGLIIVIAAGFIFMTIYMRTITAKAVSETNAQQGVKETTEEPKKQIRSGGSHPAAFITVMLVSSVLSAGASGFVVNTIVSRSYEEKLQVLGAQTAAPVATPVPEINYAVPEEDVSSLGIGGQYLVTVSDTPTGFLRVRETPNGKEIGKVSPGDKLPFLEDAEGWYKVQLEDGTEGFVSKEYSVKE